jgi:glucoamylase
MTDAPGAPGIPPRWTSSAKSAIGTALRATSRVWFTLSHGIFNEVYYPRIDQACIRDMGLVVTDGDAFFSEEKRDASSRLVWHAPGVPAFHMVNTCHQGRYRITKDVVADPYRDTVLQQTRFEALSGDAAGYHVHVLLAPHIGNSGWGNTAWVGDYKGVRMLFAGRNGVCLAVACSRTWRRTSAGFVGFSDGWQDLSAHKTMTWTHRRAENGNVALTGEIDLRGGDGSFLVALAFGGSMAEAGHRARASLLAGFPRALDAYVRDWTEWHARHGEASDAVRISASVLRCHEEKRLPGAMIASLSIPWGDTKGDEDLGGYHLVWPRDLVEAAGGLIAVGAHADARRVLDYLRTTQSGDGSWPQNMWVSGEAYWDGVQLDETAFPILLVDLLQRHGGLAGGAANGYWPMIRQAVQFIVGNGPSSQQDRWEENAGLSPFTVAVVLSALLVAADAADLNGETGVAQYLRETADAWNDVIEEYLYVRDSALARSVGVAGCYVRIAPPESADAASPSGGFVPIKNRPWPAADTRATEVISPDALALVRFGLRSADDPHIRDTVRVIDAVLKVDLPQGPMWRRYNGDGYGEHEDGSAFDGVGVGRVWPLLTGERAHFELAAARRDAAVQLLATLERCANEGGLLPEQSWDGPDVPSRELQRGRPSGSAMPLVWAHAEHVKLARSLADGRIFDAPVQTTQRYLVEGVRSRIKIWRHDRQVKSIRRGLALRVEAPSPMTVHWSTDNWATKSDVPSRDTGISRHLVDLPTDSGATIVFTMYWPLANRWEQADYRVAVTED